MASPIFERLVGAGACQPEPEGEAGLEMYRGLSCSGFQNSFPRRAGLTLFGLPQRGKGAEAAKNESILCSLCGRVECSFGFQTPQRRSAGRSAVAKSQTQQPHTTAAATSAAPLSFAGRCDAVTSSALSPQLRQPSRSSSRVCGWRLPLVQTDAETEVEAVGEIHEIELAMDGEEDVF